MVWIRFCFLLFFLFHSTVYAKPLLIGIPPFAPPFVMQLDSKTQFVGFDIDIMNEICKRLEVQCQYLPYSFNDIFTNLDAKNIDLGIGDITITSQRMSEYLFSLPYMESYAQFITTKSSKIITTDQLKGKKIGIAHEALFGPLVLEVLDGKVDFVEFHYISDMIVGLTAGDVDGIIMDAATAQSLYANNDNLALVGDRLPLGLGYGIVTIKENEDLMYKINQALLEMEADGTYISIYNIYFAGFN
ncbi:glutamine ABC transporter (plasmid) [Legionella adelaidensis]|uniref:Glutamine ABC transporter n=1 Tax=Legionella adelaidensis TaxID=45056 RepID=A0A0W0R0Z7_9GAMM|nr:transporter substrate-binding domain-containing protein [Legionella adelaidensis]KTC64767.1 glutamine ABC transporter [Legionella adelaidensis]VEH81345.1 glutamine ABC transporter [Legionella adelaidensis]